MARTGSTRYVVVLAVSLVLVAVSSRTSGAAPQWTEVPLHQGWPPCPPAAGAMGTPAPYAYGFEGPFDPTGTLCCPQTWGQIRLLRSCDTPDPCYTYPYGCSVSQDCAGYIPKVKGMRFSGDAFKQGSGGNDGTHFAIFFRDKLPFYGGGDEYGFAYAPGGFFSWGFPGLVFYWCHNCNGYDDNACPAQDLNFVIPLTSGPPDQYRIWEAEVLPSGRYNVYERDPYDPSFVYNQWLNLPTCVGGGCQPSMYEHDGYITDHCIMGYWAQNHWQGSFEHQTSVEALIDDCSSPAADFTAVPSTDGVVEGPPGTTVTFSDTAAAGATRYWTFGDQCGGGPCTATTTSSQVSHTYSLAGTYDISLTIQCGDNAPVIIPKESFVHVQDPVPFRAPEIVTGPGPGTAAVPSLNIVRGAVYHETGSGGRTYQITANSLAIRPYNDNSGTNVAIGALLSGPCGLQVVTAPGPSAMLPSLIKAFAYYGDNRIGGFDFYAYGTGKFGANVALSNVDGLGGPLTDKIVTGAGPSAVFGPQVRAFKYTGIGQPVAMQKVNFFAYGTLKYGVNVAGGPFVEGLPDEVGDNILTGPGPGFVFGPQVRAWALFSKSPYLRPINKVNFNAFSDSHYGAEVAVGKYYDPKVNTEINDIGAAPGPGPGPTWTSTVALWDFPGAVRSITAGVVAFSGFNYGANVAIGKLYDFGGELVAGAGPDPAADARVRGFAVDASPQNPPYQLSKIGPVDYLPFGPEERAGATVAVSPCETGDSVAQMQGPVPTDELLATAIKLMQDAPDSRYVCNFCDPSVPQPNWTVWGADSRKAQVVADLANLHATLADKTPQEIVATIDAISAEAGDPQLGITNPNVLDALNTQLALMRGLYDPPAFPSSAVTALITGVSDAASMALSQPTGKLFVDALPPPPPPGTTTVHVVDVNTLTVDPDRPIPSGYGTVELLATPRGRAEVYAVAKDQCPPIGPCPHILLALELDRFSPLGSLPIDGESIAVTTLASATAMYVTPPSGATALLQDTAYVAGVRSSPAGVPFLRQVKGVRNFNTAVVSEIDLPLPGPGALGYAGLAESPDSGVPLLADRLYAADAAGVDAVSTKGTPPVVFANALHYPSGFSGAKAMTSGITAGGAHRVFVAGNDQLLAYEPAGGIDPVLTAPLYGDTVAAHLSLDGRFVLVTRHPAGTATAVTVLDADSLLVIRDSNLALCGSGPCDFSALNPMSLTIDGSHAIASNPNENLLDFVYLQPPRAVVTAGVLADTVAAVPPEDFVKPQDQQKLLADVGQVQHFLDLAEKAPKDAARTILLQNADMQLAMAEQKFDGCPGLGGSPAKDVVTDCAEQQSLMHVAGELMLMIEGQLPAAPPAMP